MYEDVKREFDRLELPLSKAEILDVVRDPRWQKIRLSMLGTSTEQKVVRCVAWLELNGYSRSAQVQVMNYKNALRRAGLLPPSTRKGEE